MVGYALFFMSTSLVIARAFDVGVGGVVAPFPVATYFGQLAITSANQAGTPQRSPSVNSRVTE